LGFGFFFEATNRFMIQDEAGFRLLRATGVE
jgi:hypothetical protein